MILVSGQLKKVNKYSKTNCITVCWKKKLFSTFHKLKNNFSFEHFFFKWDGKSYEDMTPTKVILWINNYLDLPFIIYQLYCIVGIAKAETTFDSHAKLTWEKIRGAKSLIKLVVYGNKK